MPPHASSLPLLTSLSAKSEPRCYRRTVFFSANIKTVLPTLFIATAVIKSKVALFSKTGSIHLRIVDTE